MIHPTEIIREIEWRLQTAQMALDAPTPTGDIGQDFVLTHAKIEGQIKELEHLKAWINLLMDKRLEEMRNTISPNRDRE